jgi:hypothetical protein
LRTAIAVLILVAASGCKRGKGEAKGAPLEAPQNARSGPAPELDLVVLLVIDQWPSWGFSHDVEVLDGGLARLVAEGVYFPEAEYPYASTFTAPGHATLGTGAPPSASGILANGWFRRERKKYQAATDDLDHPIFDLNAIAAGKAGALVEGEGASPAALLVDGVADQLRRDKPEAKAISIGIKQRAAVLQTGRRPHLAVWYDDDRVAMTTGTFWAEAPPGWLVELARTSPVSKRLDETRWDVSDPEFLAAHTGGADDFDGEASVMGFDRAFPHDLAITPDRHKAVRVTPSGTAMTFETARAAIAGEKLGKRGVTDYLAVTISSHDYAGHFWGQRSWERFDTLRQIDRQLGEFLDHLDAVIGADRYAVVVTSDHGAVPLIERSVAGGRAARRIPYEELLGTANAAIEGVLGKGSWVIGYSANSLYLTDEALAHPGAPLAIEAAVLALRARPNMGAVGSRAAIAGGDCGRHAGALLLLCASAHPDRSGEILLAPDRYSLFIEAKFPTGTAHGTPSVEDRMVPLIVRRPGIAPRRAGDRPSTLQVAPTIASLLGISAPELATAEPVELRSP